MTTQSQNNKSKELLNKKKILDVIKNPKTASKYMLSHYKFDEEIAMKSLRMAFGKIREDKSIYGNTPIAQFQGEDKVAGLRTLIAAGFGKRVIDEAVARPRGKVALTLKYGRDKALRIINRRKLIS